MTDNRGKTQRSTGDSSQWPIVTVGARAEKNNQMDKSAREIREDRKELKHAMMRNRRRDYSPLHSPHLVTLDCHFHRTIVD